MPAVLVLALFAAVSCQRVKGPDKGKEAQKQIDSEEKAFKGCIVPAVLTQESALEYLSILTEGDHETISFYSEYEKSDKYEKFPVKGDVIYENDICAAAKVLARKRNPMAYDLMLRVIKEKADYPKAVTCAVRAVMIYGEFIEGYWRGDTRGVPALLKVVKSKDPEVRLNAAGALLSLGEGDIALPILDEFIKAGNEQSIPAVNKLFAPEQKMIGTRVRIVRSDTRLFDEKGKDILLRALNYPNNKVKVYAASKLIGMGIEKNRAEQTAISILKKLKDKKADDYEEIDAWIQDRDATFRAAVLLGKINSPVGNKLLKELAENDRNKSLQERAQSALKTIQQ